ncbi:MAG: flagellar assembly protein FliW [Planctomycetes bacterium]|nr:flagellar assembly protein FliW [Planctomycetota bacterium]
MIIETSRFGQIEIDEQRLIEFQSGILGFPNNTHYALVQAGEGSGFYWLQAVDRPDLAFVVCDPRLFVSDYTVPIRSDELTELGVETPKDAQVFIIVNKVEDLLMGNLQGPLVVGVETRRGRQLVLTDRRYSTRHPLMRVPGREALSKTG